MERPKPRRSIHEFPPNISKSAIMNDSRKSDLSKTSITAFESSRELDAPDYSRNSSDESVDNNSHVDDDDEIDLSEESSENEDECAKKENGPKKKKNKFKKQHIIPEYLSERAPFKTYSNVSENLTIDESKSKINSNTLRSESQPKPYFKLGLDFIESYFLLFLLVPCAFGALYAMSSTEDKVDMESIRKRFPTQEASFWTDFEPGVEDVVNLHRPSTFILLYEENAENTLNNLLAQISKFAVCKISDCSKEPIILTDTELNSPEVVKDYGSIIEKYRSPLREKGVMIIKHLENIRGISAQAFHSLCDEFTPVVEKSLFIFTMRVDKLLGKDTMKFIEEYLKKKWTDVKPDALNALITRITSMPLQVLT